MGPARDRPLAGDGIDAVVANHMLYHTDLDAALAEIGRALRSGGRLFATTNGESNLRELQGMLAATTTYEPSVTDTFTLENRAERLARQFETVRRHEREAALRVPDPEPLVAYAASLPGVGEAEVAAFAELAAERLADGPLEIEKSMGLFVAEAGGEG